MSDTKQTLLMIMFGRQVGGAELQFIELANNLANKHQVRLISLGGAGAVNSVFIDPRIDLCVYSYKDKWSTVLELFKVLYHNVKYPATNIICTSFIADLIGLLIHTVRTTRLISLQTVSKCMHYPFIDRRILRRYDLLIAGADDIRSYLIRHGQDPDRIEVIHNWVDFNKRKSSESIEVTRLKLGLQKQQIIGCIGRLHQQKGQLYLIRAFELLLKKFPDIVLLLVGDGEYKGELESEAIRLNVHHKVFFAGTMVGSEYNNYLAAIDIYVQPSVFEGLPRTLLDAMYLGKPIVASDINGNREAIKNNYNGLLVPPKDVQALVSSITHLLLDREAYALFSGNAIRTAIEGFSMTSKMAQFECIISRYK